MGFELKDNSGILFKNDRKEKDSQPDRTGSAMIDGREFWVSGWVKNGNKGPFMTLAFKPKDGKEQRPAPVRQAPADIKPPLGNAPQGRRGSMKESVLDDDGDTIPFAPEIR